MNKLASWEILTGTRPTIESDRTIATVSFPLKSTMQRKVADENVPVNENEGKNISFRQKAIIDLIKSNPTISMLEMSVALKVSISTIEREIPKMSTLIKHIGPKKGGYWEILKNRKHD